MKIIYLTLFVLTCTILQFDVLGQNASDYQLFLRSGSVIPEKNINQKGPGSTNRRAVGSSERSFLIIQFENIPDEAEKNLLKQSGIQLLDYIPNNAFTATVTGELNLSVLQQVKARSVIDLKPEEKMQPGLAEGNYPPHAEKVSGMLDVWVNFPRSYSFDEVKKELLDRNYEIIPNDYTDYQIIELRVSKDRLAELAGSPFVQYIEPIPARLKSFIDKDVANARANVLGSTLPGGFNLQGKGVVVGVGDESNPTQHVDFSKRIINREALATGEHGLLVMGIIGGAGIFNEKYRGYAPKSTMLTQYFSNILNYAPTYVQDYNMVLTNNSYGVDPTSCSDFGSYNLYSYFLDQQARDLPSLLSVFASGNSGTSTLCGPTPNGFANILSGFQTSKNIITVGNTIVTGPILGSSSKGPVKDGRIKPEISAQGTSITSTIPTDSYRSSSGTSMSAPGVTGGLALLYERYRSGHGQSDPKSALMKALICNGATDLGLPGPDYSYGFGWLNLLRSITMLDNNNYFGDKLANNVTNTRSVNVREGTVQLKVMLYWNDLASSSLTSKALINDLDLTVTTPGGTVILPKILNPANPSAAATNGADHINNIEQVIIDSPVPGDYVVSVIGKTIPNDAQEYFVVYDAMEAGTTLTYPIGNEHFVKGDQIYISWDSYGDNTNTFKVQYTVDDGATWKDINVAVANNLRQVIWTVPDAVTDKAKIRITQNGVVIESKAFVITGLPVVKLSTVQCEGYIAIEWAPLPGITSYEVMKLEGDEMKFFAKTSSTNFVLSGLSRDSTYYVTVRPILNDNNTLTDNNRGRRALAVSRKPDSGTCGGTISDNDLSLDAIVSPANSGRKLTSSEFSNQIQITIRIKNLDNVASTDPIDVTYSVNDGDLFHETIAPVIDAGSTYDHTFSLRANFSVVGSYKLFVSANKGTDPVGGNNSLTKTFNQLANPAVSMPFFDPVEGIEKQEVSVNQMGLAGADRYDFFNTSPIGRLRTFVNSNIAFSGNMAFTLDANRYDAAGNTNYLVGTFNLSGYINKDIRLNFQFRNHGQLSNPANRVWIRGHDTDPWLEVYDLFANQNTPQNGYKLSANIEVNNILKSQGQTLSTSFQVRWGQWGDMITADSENGAGYTIDDINIYEIVADVQLLSINSPVSSGCGLGSAERVNVTIRNSASHDVANVLVKMQVDQGTVFEKKITVAANTTMTYTHPQAVDLSAVGSHVVKVWVDAGTNNYAENDAIVLNFYNSPLVASFPYLQNFESDNGFWHSEGINNSWEYGTPSSPKINKAASGILAWKTKLTGNYNDDELSFLYSPCFSIGGLAHPTLSFSTALDIDDCENDACDAVYVEYSTDGKTWSLLGAKDSGTNWYDESNNGVDSWSIKDYTRWHVSTTALPTGANTIRLRFVMKSDNSNVREGIAIDDIHIYDLNNSIYSSGPASATITQSSVNGSNWINFTEDSKIIASIKPNNFDLGSTDLQTYLNSGNVRNNNSQYYLDRNFVIRPANKTLPGEVTVRVYFLDSDVEKLLQASGCSNCQKPESAFELAISKFNHADGTIEDGNVENDLGGSWLQYNSPNVLKVPYDNGYYAEFKTSTFSEFWLAKGFIGTGSSLPVELISFTAKKKSGADASQDVALEWATATEKNFDHFEIELALGEENVRQNIFSKIGEVDGSGDSGSELKYSFTDRNVGDGVTRYYRLKMVDADETFSYSNLRSVLFNERQAWRVFPNPSTGVFNLEFKSEKEKQVTMSIYDLSGRLIKKAAVSPTGFLQKQKIDMSSSGFEPGVYMLEVASGQDKQVFKLMRD